jgi:hypothetical protein
MGRAQLVFEGVLDVSSGDPDEDYTFMNGFTLSQFRPLEHNERRASD